MKKLCSLFLAIVCLTVVTGCGSSKNEITCTMTEDGQKVVATVRTDKDDKITNVKMSTSMEAPSKEELELAYGLLNVSVGAMNSANGVKASVSKKNLTLTMTIQVDLTKISDEDLDKLDFDFSNTATGTEFKKNAIESGATCK